MSSKIPKSLDLRNYPGNQEIREEAIEARREQLKTLGLSDKTLEKMEERRPTLYPRKTIDDKIDGLKERGFKDPVKMIEKYPPVLGLGFENIDAKIEGFKERGFNNPVKIIKKLPPVLGLGFENIDDKIEGLKERGFKDPVNMIEKLPQILNYGFENIDDKIEGLKKRKFKDPMKMIEKHPHILSYGFENIDGKIDGLKERGFKNPVKMIEKLPAILGYGFENIDGKIEGLKKRKFKDPMKMIEKLPAILGYGFENIDGKIIMLRQVISWYNLNLSAVDLMEKINSLFSTKIDKLWVLIRIAREKEVETEEVTDSLIRKLVLANLENMVIASRKRVEMTIQEVLAEAKQIKKQKLSKAEKRVLIDTLPNEDRIKQRYFRGYPKKLKKAA